MRDDVIIIEKRGCQIYSKLSEIKDFQGGIHHECEAVAGIINVKNHIFVTLIKQKEKVAVMHTGDVVYMVKQIEFIPFDHNFSKYEHLNVEVIKYTQGVKKILEEEGFYFSYYADLTSN